MQLSDLQQIHTNYDHIYLSPHIDDVALSCGGTIALQRKRNERVLVVTLCTAAPSPEISFSALAEEFHSQWKLSPDQVVSARLHEDRLAMEQLDVDYHWVHFVDAIYRYPDAYHSRDTLFNQPATDDPLGLHIAELITTLSDHTPPATLYAPLGVGSHVDHLLTHATVAYQSGSNVTFYEDFPYVAVPGALEQRLATLNTRMTSTMITIDPVIETKLAAINTYVSQMDELFGGSDTMRQTVTQYARSLCPDGATYGERFWKKSFMAT
ncbi:MAG: GlcNAc-PI de-N-acetylase [Chloroflexi bacterium AL-W]|nr:GlcNAc-PI de-N-acetylase [Chloroflexi bacterium AL-N1]NOK69006.1 GlcNAc-PI de-N-acetylase [Chloroflexi bacterium AL-N10]NOK76989.1 GlcNAc-PI de-N-acetylase [Chloroflexi bacterium AL-N5]NOK82623.1 GlcNAc-PI de-N-acetylase [Chloroflexi bacterium AL-W]NOK90846.1 GlcNAc-PI de-N-acetylase [Chloroflexi bacterium AL-N15]